MNPVLRRVLGIALVGDGIAALVAPRKYLRSLECGGTFINGTLEFLAENPELTRMLCVSEIAFGLFLTLKE